MQIHRSSLAAVFGILVGATGCGDDAGVTCGPGVVAVGGECVPIMDADRTDGAMAPLPDAATGSPDAATGSPDAATSTDSGNPVSSVAICGDGVCSPPGPGEQLTDGEYCYNCGDDCSGTCAPNTCSWIFYCAREERCGDDVPCIAECMNDGDATAQSQYVDLYAGCLETTCRDECLAPVLGPECARCACTSCSGLATACSGLVCSGL